MKSIKTPNSCWSKYGIDLPNYGIDLPKYGFLNGRIWLKTVISWKKKQENKG